MAEKMILVSMVLLLFCGCASEDKPRYTEEELAQIPQPIRTGLPAPSGGFTLAVGDDTISSNEITGALLPKLEQMAQQTNFGEFSSRALPAVAVTLRDRIGDILLYQKAKAAAPEEIDDQLEKIVEGETRKFLMGFNGDYAKAEAFLQNYYGMNWKEYRRHQRRMILSSSYLQGSLQEETPVTYSQIRQYYDNNMDESFSQDGSITIRLIDIDISQVKADPNTTSQQAAAKLASEVSEKINAGEDFSLLAIQYSHGYRAAQGGLWKPVKPDSLAEPYDILAEQSRAMNISDVTSPIETAGHLFIMKLEDKQTSGVVPFEQVQGQIEQKLRMERKRAGFEKVMNKVLRDAAITGIDEFADFCLLEIYAAANAG